VLALFFFAFGCAKRGFITGGEPDIFPPKVIKTSPENFSTHFNSQKIVIHFDEYVRLKDISKQLIVSPPLKHKPEITLLNASREITIRIKDTLQPNTTYNFNFGQSIQDNNEGNVLQGFRYVFSTGNYIDSLSVGGTITDALNKKSDDFVSIFLYQINEDFNDSIIYKQNPTYITNTLDTVAFKLENIKQGNYFLVALKDKNNNNRFDPKQDKIGFHNQIISVPTDEEFKLNLFEEIPDFRPIRVFEHANNRIILAHEGNIEQHTKIELRNQNAPLETIITKFPEKDSLNIWYKPIQTDSLELKIHHNDIKKRFSVTIRQQKSDTLSLTMKSPRKLNFNENVIYISTTPLIKWDNSKIELQTKDSLQVDFQTKYDILEQRLEIIFEKEEEQNYSLTMYPKAVTDFFGQTNDTIKNNFSTTTYSDYGNLKATLQNVKEFPIIVQLINDKGKIITDIYSEKENVVDFSYLTPGIYDLRVIYDTNKNKTWDTGNYLQKIQPEKVIYFSEKIDVRANWDIEQNFILDN